MSVTQTVEIPASHRLTIDVPSEIPAGRAILTFTAAEAEPEYGTKTDVEVVRQLLRKEMTEKGTLAIMAESGDGWEAHVREHYAES